MSISKRMIVMNLNEFERKSSGLESTEFQQDVELKAQMIS